VVAARGSRTPRTIDLKVVKEARSRNLQEAAGQVRKAKREADRLALLFGPGGHRKDDALRASSGRNWSSGRDDRL